MSDFFYLLQERLIVNIKLLKNIIIKFHIEWNEITIIV